MNYSDLGSPLPIKLEEIHLDPNNPRVAPEPAPGYEDAKKLFDAEVQQLLVTKVYDVYKAADLENSIIEQGWTPVDPILVWAHPSGAGHVVVEGNTRISVLRRVRDRLEKEKAKLDRMEKGGFPKQEVRKQEGLIERIQKLVSDTNELQVYPVLAKTAADLVAKLPRLLGVRHIFPAKHWTPYATNLYILSLYEKAWGERYGDADLKLDEAMLEIVADQLPMKSEAIRKSIQAASAFGHFKRIYDEKVQDAGNKFVDGDQYFFDNILSNKHARDEFGFSPNSLRLSEEGEEALFQWAFAKQRSGGGDDDEAINENVFQKAEDIRIWQRISRYDSKTGVTNFAKRLSVANPGDAVAVWRLEREQLAHREKNTPIKTLDDLLKALKDLKADTLKAQASHLRPMFAEIAEKVHNYLHMIDGAVNDAPTE
ncbi:MAG TPA: hypothetical protein VFP12_00480 [Allosphingosinicella sp.]|nr:hypothetical protein [Allosphingosinicella sp.]